MNQTGLFIAEGILSDLCHTMDEEYKNSGASWSRDWMQKHVNERATLINARKILLDRAGITFQEQQPASGEVES